MTKKKKWILAACFTLLILCFILYNLQYAMEARHEVDVEQEDATYDAMHK